MLTPWASLLLVYSWLCFEWTQARQILVFGGNGFMGADTVERFLKHEDRVTIVNRGNWYWDSKSRILPNVKHISCDRKKKLRSSCEPLLTYIEEVGQIDVVLDFSAYGAHEVNESTEALRGHVRGLYIQVSTDSVYDVSSKQHDGPSKETDAVRPASEEERARLAEFDSYGHHKMNAEEALMEQRMEGGLPFVLLRLPDVFGPRDSTNRFWIYILWTKLTSEMANFPVLIPHFLDDYPISFVFSPDVAQIIFQLTQMGPQVNDQVVNLAYEETVTLQQLLDDIKDALGVSGTPYISQDSTASHHMYFYPSVRRGPVSVAKAQNLLNWKPTPWQEAVKNTVSFYEDAMTSQTFSKQRDDVIRVLANYVYASDKQNYYTALESIYNIDLSHLKNTKDEL